MLKSTSFKPQNTPTKFPREILEHINFPDNKTVKSRSLWWFGSFDVAPFQAPTPAVTPPVTPRFGVKNCVPRTKFCPNFCDHPKWRRCNQQHRLLVTCPNETFLYLREQMYQAKNCHQVQANHDFQIWNLLFHCYPYFLELPRTIFCRKLFLMTFLPPGLPIWPNCRWVRCSSSTARARPKSFFTAGFRNLEAGPVEFPLHLFTTCIQ